MMQVYRCRYCETRFVVAPSVGDSFLPIEVKSITDYELQHGIEKADYFRHVSHLRNCARRKLDWDSIQKQFKPREKRYVNG
jgi:hypothetical protein